MKILTVSVIILSCCFALPTWESIGPDKGGPQRDIAFAPSNEDIVYTLTKHPTWSYLKPRIYRSVGSGNKWSEMGYVSDFVDGYSLAIDPTNSDILYVGGSQRIMKSTDAGVTWSESMVSDDTIPELVVNPSSSSTVYGAGKEGGFAFLKSIDGGVTWATDTLESTGVATCLSIAPSNHNTLYIAGRKGGPPNQRRARVFRSLDGGETWTNVTSNLDDTVNTVRLVWSIAVHETIPDLVYIGTNKAIWYSADGGSTWSKALACSIAVYDITTTADNPSTMYAAIDSFIYKSTDAGTTWAVTGSGYHRARHYNLAVKDGDESFVYAVNGEWNSEGIFRSTDGGVTWDTTTTGMAMDRIFCCSAAKSAPSHMFIQRHHIGVYKTVDYGSTWIPIEDFTNGCWNICDFAFHNTSEDTVLALEGQG